MRVDRAATGTYTDWEGRRSGSRRSAGPGMSPSRTGRSCRGSRVAMGRDMGFQLAGGGARRDGATRADALAAARRAGRPRPGRAGVLRRPRRRRRPVLFTTRCWSTKAASWRAPRAEGGARRPAFAELHPEDAAASACPTATPPGCARRGRGDAAGPRHRRGRRRRRASSRGTSPGLAANTLLSGRRTTAGDARARRPSRRRRGGAGRCRRDGRGPSRGRAGGSCSSRAWS